MNENSVLYLIVAFVLAEGINVWACWNPSPYNLEGVSREGLSKGERGAIVFTVGYGAFASYACGNLLPLFIALSFSGVMLWIYENEFEERNS